MINYSGNKPSDITFIINSRTNLYFLAILKKGYLKTNKKIFLPE